MRSDYDIPNSSRRDLLKYGFCIAGSSLLTAGITLKFLDRGQQRIGAEGIACQPPKITPEVALDRLMLGNQRFVQNKQTHPNQNRQRMKEVSSGQKPFVAILGCADSRVPAEIVFDQGLGDLFVVRNAGNVVTPEEIGSLEFAALELGIKTILILGHQKCGAVKATLDGNAVPGKIGSIIEAIKPAIKNKPSWDEAVIANIKLQIKNLRASTLLSELVANEELKIVGGIYEIETGQVKLEV